MSDPSPVPESPMWCDCRDSVIRWVDDSRPHVSGITGPGWFCTGCLTEFVRVNDPIQTTKPAQQTPLIFSQRKEIAAKAEQWCRDHNCPASPLNIVTAISSLKLMDETNDEMTSPHKTKGASDELPANYPRA